ncbi:MAG UNVERIFIED_CONTAM: hypothetical protein LVR18_27845 [Planctomycetaceae bacterium]|jgi:hypothetical protein
MRFFPFLNASRNGKVNIQWPWSWSGAPGVMIQAAEAHAAAKNFGAARELLNRADAEIEKKGAVRQKERPERCRLAS